MHSSGTLPVIVLTTIVFSSAFGSAQAASYRDVAGVQPGHVTWIYRQPDTASPRVGYLKAGALRVRTIGCKRLPAGGWCRVMRRGTRGWVQDRYLKADNLMRG